jgi:hypothetical protein
MEESDYEKSICEIREKVRILCTQTNTIAYQLDDLHYDLNKVTSKLAIDRMNTLMKQYKDMSLQKKPQQRKTGFRYENFKKVD